MRVFEGKGAGNSCRCGKVRLTGGISLFIPFVIFLFSFLSPVDANARNPRLTGPESVKEGQTFTVSVAGAPDDSAVRWTWDPQLNCREEGLATLSCVVEAMDASSADQVTAVVGAAIESLRWSERLTVSVVREGGRKTKTKTGTTGTDVSPPPPAKIRKIEGLFDQLKAGALDEMGFFNAMGDSKVSVRDLVGFKGDVINRKAKELGDYRAALQYWNDNYRGMEQKLMSVRKDNVIKAWDAVVARYYSDHPDSPPLARMDVGGWVSEPMEKMRFEGDIDFTVIMLDAEQAKVVRDLFGAEIGKIFNLDMVAVDALSTAHRAATLSVYIGDYGADWAEIDAIRRGKMQIIRRDDDGNLVKHDADATEKAVMFAVLKNNIAMSRGEPDRLADILQEKKTPTPKYDMEPGISLEFLRHITTDAVHADLALHEKIIKMSKYLDRSAKEHDKILEAAGAKPQPIDTDIVKFAGMITELKQMKGINPEIALWLIMKRTGDLAGSPDWVNNPEGALKAIAKRMTDVITHNIEEGLDARIKKAESMKTLAEQDAEKKRLLDDLENEFKAFSGGEEAVPFPPKAREVMLQLAEYFKSKAFKLPAAEQKRLKELIEKAADNPEMTKIVFAMVQEAAMRAYQKSAETIGAINNFLDTLDNKTIESLRSTGIIELERTVVEGGKEEVRKTTIIRIESIAKINQALNESVLGKIGQSAAFQAFNLASEVKSYYDAVMKAGSWNESFTNLSVEIFRRRTPVGGAVEAFVHGNYLRMGVEVVYTIFPPLAIPEGLYGMALGAAEWSVGKMQEWKYEDMVNELYRGAKFEQAGAGWKLTSVTYKCPSEGEMTVTGRDAILKLPMRCTGLYQILIPQIKNHPVLLQYQEMLDNSAVSSGRMGTFPFNWDVRGGKYGEQLLKTYRKKVDDTAVEYFKGVVEQLEKAQAWWSGKKLHEVVRIEKELGCRESLITFNVGYFGGDSYLEDVKELQALVDNFGQLKNANESILKIKDKWQANDPAVEERKDHKGEKYVWVKGLFPDCSKSAIANRAKEAKELDGRVKAAVKKCQAEVEKIVGRDKVTEKLLAPLVKPAICLAVYEETNRYIAEGCKKEYDEALAALGGQGSDLKITDIRGPEKVCIGTPATFKAKYDRPCDDCVAEWSILEYGEETSKSDKNEATWTPKYSGGNTLRLKARISKDAAKEAVMDKKVTVLPADKCPKIRLKFIVKTTTVQEKDVLDVAVEPEGGLPEGEKLLEYAWSEDGKRNIKFTGSTYQFSGLGRKGKKVTIGVKARTSMGYTEEFHLPVTVSDSDKDELTVRILPAEITVLSGEDPVTLKSDVIRKVDSGRMKYQWTVVTNGGAPWVSSETVQSVKLDPRKYREGDRIDVTLLVLDIGNTPGSPTYGQILREGKAAKSLTVGPEGDIVIKLGPVPEEIEDNKTLVVCVESPALRPGDPGDRLAFEWFDEDGKFWRPNTVTRCSNLSTRGLAGQTVRLKVVVRDKFGRSAEKETAPVKVVDADLSPKLQVSVVPENASIMNDQTITFVVTAVPLKDSGSLSFNGVRMPPGQTVVTFPETSFRDNENWVTVPFTVTDEKGRKAETHATVYVTKKKDKPDDKKIDGAKPEDTRPGDDITGVTKPEDTKTDSGKKDDGKKEPPVCTYKYSEWGECPREKKIQTRSVIAKEPAGCVERDKPALEQVCTPPKTEADKRTDYLNCLCRACGGTAGGYYGPSTTEKGGPCVCFGWLSGWRTPVPGGPPDHVKSCYKGAYGHDPSDKELADADKDRKNENRKHTDPLKVKIKPSKNPAEFGDIVTLYAETTGGSGGNKWTWGGAAEDAKDANAKFVKTRTAGGGSVSVSVTDQDGNSASDTVTIQVQAIIVKLEKESPKEDTIPVGGTAKFIANVMSGKNNAGGSFKYQWQPHPELAFGDPKTPTFEQTGGSQMRNSARFSRPGPAKVWVQVLKEIEGRFATVGESEQITVEAVNPEVIITYTPKEAYLGKELFLSAVTKPPMGESMVSLFWDIPGYHTGTGSKATIKPKDTKPITATVTAKAVDGGDELGKQQVTITPLGYTVTVSEPKYLGTPPQIWKCDTQLGHAKDCGMVQVKPTQFAVHEAIFFKASVTPAVEGVNYNWTVDPSGSCGMPGGGSELRVQCSNTGTYTITAEATKDGIKLGAGSQTLTVSISQEMINSGKKAKEAHEKLQKAKQLVTEGKLQEGIALAKEAQGLDSKNTEAKQLADKWSAEKQTTDDHVGKVKSFLQAEKLEDAARELTEAKKLHPKYQPVVDAEKQFADARVKKNEKVKAAAEKLDQANKAVAQGKLQEGIQLANEAAKIDPKNGEARLLADKWTREKQQADTDVAKVKDALKADNLAEAEKALAAAKAIHPKYQPVVDAEKQIADTKAKKQGDMKAAHEKVKQAEGLYINGKIEEAIALLNDAKKIDPKNEDAPKLGQKWSSDLQQINAHVSKAQDQIKAKKFDEAKTALEQAKRINAKYKTVVETEQVLAQKLAEDKKLKDEQVKKEQEEQDKTKKSADKLWDECSALAKQGRNSEALARCRESVAIMPDEKRSAVVRDLEKLVAQEQGKKKQDEEKKAAADRLWDECSALAKQGRNSEALAKCNESVKLWPNDKRTSALKDMERTVAQEEAKRQQEEAKKRTADELWDQCSGLAKQNNLEGALSKCRESLTHWSSEKRQAAVKDMEAQVAQTKREQQNRATADRLWDECSALAKQGRNKEALAKCRESLSYWSSDKRVAATKDLERVIASANTVQPPADPVVPPPDPADTRPPVQTPTKDDIRTPVSSPYYHVDLTPYGGKKGSARKVKDIEVDDGSWIRLKATHEKRMSLAVPLPSPVTANSIAIVSNLDNAHNVKQGMTVTTITVQTTTGDRVFDIKAGVHSSEWNRSEGSGADHQFPKDSHLGDKRWLNVFPLPSGSVVTGIRFRQHDFDKKYYHGDAAPGFCLRGITLIKSGTAGGSSVSDNGTGAGESTPPQSGRVIFDNGNIGGVYNAPTKATTFTINQSHVVTMIQNYHWNNGSGTSSPGSISLKGSGGKTYGPWQATGSPGQGGVKNAYWRVYPNVTIPAGTYTIADSQPSTWAQNQGSGGAGHSRVEGYPAGAGTSTQGGTQQSSGSQTTSGYRNLSAEIKNTSSNPVHIAIDSEQFGPTNRIMPGEKKNTTYQMSSGGIRTVRFSAGRNGQKLTECRWEFDPSQQNRVVVITFSEPKNLSCTTGVR